MVVSSFLLFRYYNYPIFKQWKYWKVDHVTQIWILRPPYLSWFSSVICHKRKAPIIPEREIKNEEGRQKSFPSDVKWVRKYLYQVVMHLTSWLHTHPPTDVNLTFVVATWVWTSSLRWSAQFSYTSRQSSANLCVHFFEVQYTILSYWQL